MSGRAPSIGAVVLRVHDLERMTAFWSAALDYAPRYAPEDDWIALGPRDGTGVNLSLDRRRSEYGLPPRLHLDLYAEDRDAEVARLVALGAAVVPLTHRREVDWVLLEDPEGNPHSHGRRTASRRAGTGERGPNFDVVQLPEEGEPG